MGLGGGGLIGRSTIKGIIIENGIVCKRLRVIAEQLISNLWFSRVVVLDNGAIVEFDSPANLLNVNSLFRKMAQDANLA